ncbi:hypothetical protein BDZ89DRAFT_1161536 [Hymenopellis radicata]|nr:hypothetical protein BDZ89DRAFT_1161536 [Hymenopellis radicata]
MSYTNDTFDDPSPDYNAAVSRSNTSTTGSSGYLSHYRSQSFDDFHPRNDDLTNIRRLPRAQSALSSKHERYEYAYSLLAGGAQIQFIVSVQPNHGTPTSGKYTISLSLKVDKMTRSLGEPIQLKLSVDPRRLHFIVFLFPGKTSLPVGALYSYRVWLRVNDVDHRLFGQDDLWIAKDPDFASIADASIARMKKNQSNSQMYESTVGKARVQFIVRWLRVAEDMYDYTMEYDCSGVGAMLFEDLRLKVDGDPRTVTFHIYTVPMKSLPIGASHRLRVWMRTFCGTSDTASLSIPYNDSYIYQRIWKSDSLKIGGHLDFSALGSKMIVGHSLGSPTTVTTATATSKKRVGQPHPQDANDHVEIG